MDMRVLVGAGNTKILKQLSNFLASNGYLVLAEIDEGYDFLRRVHSTYPDICIVDSSIRGLKCQELVEEIVLEKIAPVIVLISEFELQNFYQLNQEAIFAPIIKPINKNILLNNIQLLIKTNRNIQKLEREVKVLKSTYNEKELIKKAKKMLMENLKLTEEQAHRQIQKQSMDKGISKTKIAEAILLKYSDV